MIMMAILDMLLTVLTDIIEQGYVVSILGILGSLHPNK